MKNGVPEFKKDALTLLSAYRKIKAIDGMTKEPLTVEEQVLIYSVAKWLERQVEK